MENDRNDKNGAVRACPVDTLKNVIGGEAVYLNPYGESGTVQRCSDPNCIFHIWSKTNDPKSKCPVCGAKMETRDR